MPLTLAFSAFFLLSRKELKPGITGRKSVWKVSCGILRLTNLQFFNKVAAGTTLDFADDSQVKYAGELNSVVAGGIEYQNVRVFENLIQTDDRLPRKVYYAKGIGVIRKELFNGQIWNLKRYFINR